MPPVALITDFGLSDWYGGEMKGAMHAAFPGVTIIDITHDIPFGDIRRAAFTLAACCRSFPQGTVFCVVVDPGVGSSRRAIAAGAGPYRFIGPDNGVLSWAIGREADAAVRSIDNSALFRMQPPSATFHGRDIFGPVAARLAAGLPFAETGTVAADYVRLPFPHPVATDRSVTAEILAVDRFGNAITAIDVSLLHRLERGAPLTLRCAGHVTPIGFGTYFQSVAAGEALCYIGSCGFVEIAVNGGSAGERFGLRGGDRIELSSG